MSASSPPRVRLGAHSCDAAPARDARSAPRRAGPAPENLFWHAGRVAADARATQFGRRPLTLWLTGLSGAGKSTLAGELERLLLRDRWPCAVLDGDNLRHRLNRDLGFGEQDRQENVRRVAEVARLMNGVGLVVIASLISPFRDDRAMAREIVGRERFSEVYVSTPLDECERRDPKGLYRKARGGLLPNFTGVCAPYEPPVEADLVLDTARLSLDDAAAMLRAHLIARCAGSDVD
ncbi:adenylyl-sulfate kinase [Burkholderia thailandensis]|nr:adenylyl-sulfate kinase [Burkholderia thailandensis]AHI75331.1 adenylylsulfate kinase [Burkholderia thailandensis 2002721723]AIP28029.1 adenylylsulfate kinase [Burkholderia thailandensis E264]AJY02338.1 adenylyl-sulfate kinase [Burkholderia thailandensis 2002721643]AVR08350.1 adenylyl-sulfate kinase [Burkholderia thailandensis]KIS54292.1 adenylyl-sulfate kinase [Burkholderia thailandensis Phuket 4W-1]